MPLRVGIDLVAVATTQESLATHGERYLDRLFSAAEVADCRGERGLDVEGLAARFAAKEAVIKVLRPDDEPVPWRSIQVRRHPSGALDIVLSDEAADLAHRTGVVALEVSITHEGDYACAVVVAQLA